MSSIEQEAQLRYREDGDNIVVLQSIRNQLPLVIVFIAVMLSTLYLTFVFSEYAYQPLAFTDTFSLQMPILVIMPLMVLALLLHRLYDARFVVCPEYVLYIEGLVSWRERSIRLEYKRIQEIKIDESILQRILGVGDVIVTPIATAVETSLRIGGVVHPRTLKDLIRERAHSSVPDVSDARL